MHWPLFVLCPAIGLLLWEKLPAGRPSAHDSEVAEVAGHGRQLPIHYHGLRQAVQSNGLGAAETAHVWRGLLV